MTEPDPTPAPVTGENVQAVRDAIEAMRTGAGDFEAVKAAVRSAKFVPRSTARSEVDLAQRWDYIPEPDSFTDTVSVAQWQRVLTREQVRELKGMAQHTDPSPSRLPDSQEN